MLLTFSNRAPRKQLGRPTIHGPRATNVTEIGPQSALQGPINHMLQAFQGAKKPSYVASLDRGQDASASLLRAIGRVYCSGYPVDILRVNSLDRETPRPPPPKMPRYPFNHEKKYWRESLLSHNFRSQSARRHDLLGVRSIDWNPQVAQWRHILRLGEMPWLRDHKIAGEIVFPGAGYVVMAVESLKQLVERSVAVLNGEIDPVEVIFQHGLAELYYGDVLASEHHSHAASTYLDLLCFKNPSMKILEVGAGTGRQTLPLLETMSGDGVKKWERYDYTDISPAFLSQASINFQGYSGRMTFTIRNISKDPISQSFVAASYDLVVASHVLHATDILHESLTNIRKLLMPSGKLLLFETTKLDALIVFAFGLLKGWWSSLDHEERSLHSPCLSEETQTRFSSIMVATAIAPVANIHTTLCTSPEVGIIMDGGSKTQNMIADAMLAVFSSVIQAHKIPGLMQSNGKTFDLVVSLLEVDSVFLDGISEPDYMNLR
ncbi:hypothetical protein H633G_01326 [Metarhizium anisopliae BRIP 53284]|nr:hypothetical protein H633G_01326 [Metarhizium anisopliae BRIP 53284]